MAKVICLIFLLRSYTCAQIDFWHAHATEAEFFKVVRALRERGKGRVAEMETFDVSECKVMTFEKVQMIVEAYLDCLGDQTPKLTRFEYKRHLGTRGLREGHTEGYLEALQRLALIVGSRQSQSLKRRLRVTFPTHVVREKEGETAEMPVYKALEMKVKERYLWKDHNTPHPDGKTVADLFVRDQVQHQQRASRMNWKGGGYFLDHVPVADCLKRFGIRFPHLCEGLFLIAPLDHPERGASAVIYRDKATWDKIRDKALDGGGEAKIFEKLDELRLMIELNYKRDFVGGRRKTDSKFPFMVAVGIEGDIERANLRGDPCNQDTAEAGIDRRGTSLKKRTEEARKWYECMVWVFRPDSVGPPAERYGSDYFYFTGNSEAPKKLEGILRALYTTITSDMSGYPEKHHNLDAWDGENRQATKDETLLSALKSALCPDSDWMEKNIKRIKENAPGDCTVNLVLTTVPGDISFFAERTDKDGVAMPKGVRSVWVGAQTLQHMYGARITSDQSLDNWAVRLRKALGLLKIEGWACSCIGMVRKCDDGASFTAKIQFEADRRGRLEDDLPADYPQVKDQHIQVTQATRDTASAVAVQAVESQGGEDEAQDWGEGTDWVGETTATRSPQNGEDLPSQSSPANASTANGGQKSSPQAPSFPPTPSNRSAPGGGEGPRWDSSASEIGRWNRETPPHAAEPPFHGPPPNIRGSPHPPRVNPNTPTSLRGRPPSLSSYVVDPPPDEEERRRVGRSPAWGGFGSNHGRSYDAPPPEKLISPSNHDRDSQRRGGYGDSRPLRNEGWGNGGGGGEFIPPSREYPEDRRARPNGSARHTERESERTPWDIDDDDRGAPPPQPRANGRSGNVRRQGRKFRKKYCRTRGEVLGEETPSDEWSSGADSEDLAIAYDAAIRRTRQNGGLMRLLSDDDSHTSFPGQLGRLQARGPPPGSRATAGRAAPPPHRAPPEEETEWADRGGPRQARSGHANGWGGGQRVAPPSSHGGPRDEDRSEHWSRSTRGGGSMHRDGGGRTVGEGGGYSRSQRERERARERGGWDEALEENDEEDDQERQSSQQASNRKTQTEGRGSQRERAKDPPRESSRIMNSNADREEDEEASIASSGRSSRVARTERTQRQSNARTASSQQSQSHARTEQSRARTDQSARTEQSRARTDQSARTEQSRARTDHSAGMPGSSSSVASKATVPTHLRNEGLELPRSMQFVPKEKDKEGGGAATVLRIKNVRMDVDDQCLSQGIYRVYAALKIVKEAHEWWPKNGCLVKVTGGDDDDLNVVIEFLSEAAASRFKGGVTAPDDPARWSRPGKGCLTAELGTLEPISQPPPPVGRYDDEWDW
uniref:Uncharacterized protein n=1 Tax=Chromera velia CCMP2878 TaxID=1169474 RepID=A0A0G4I9H1_9ALVE|eukprot:Cvel_12156.t1-p1 / transcript=Cvel_12156.t1 / gene=Cvel_12156 / organism=Chromera_velia_CCMP2878 / gene_product=hypothetical protein / transcript_product=hypothetical protein / location=Cvel_scaffold784:12207-23527(+) / protein_length=1338 / sequence_SO=supercontig / SO=protein_coding / is_pseudo=false